MSCEENLWNSERTKYAKAYGNRTQFGDFFNDMVINVQLAATSASVGTVPALPAYIGANDQAVSSTAKVSAKENATTGVYTKYTHEYVDIQGNVLTVGAAAQNFVRYAEFPGQRLFKKVKFEVNGEMIAIKSDALKALLVTAAAA